MQTRSVNGEQVVWIEENILKDNKGQPVHQFIANYIAEHIGEVYTIIESGQKVYIGEDLPGEYTQSKYTKAFLRNNPSISKAKNRASANLGEMIEIATNRRWEKTKHTSNKDAKYGMYRYDSQFGFPVKNAKGDVTGANIYRAELLIRNASDGKKYLYDIVSIKKNTANSDWLTQRVTSAARKPAGQKGDVSTNNVAQDTDNVNEKFSLRDTVEETKDLVAVHNLSEEQLIKSLRLGGLPMPSIAILRAQDGHSEFGDISLVFGKDTIDPQAYRSNKLYSGDAYTPTYPKVDYKPSEIVLKKVKDKNSRLVPYEVQDALGNLMFDTDNASNNLDRYNRNMVEAYKQNDAMKYASESRKEKYEIAWKKLESIWLWKIDVLTTFDLQNVVDSKADTYYTARDLKNLLSKLYQIALPDEFVKSNLSDYIELPDLNEKKQEAFSPDEIKKLWVDYDAGNWWTGYILLMIYTGMMPGELLDASKSNIDWDGKQIVGAGKKTKERRETPIVLADCILPVLSDMCEHTSGDKLIRISKDRFYDTYYAALERAGCRRLTPYSCRHTAATSLAIENIPPSVIQKIMRHAKFTTTERYIHIDMAPMREAVNRLSKK